MPDLATVHLEAMTQAQTLQQPGISLSALPEPATLYKAGQRPAKVHRVDLEAWLNLGWSLTPATEAPATVVPVAPPEVLVAPSAAPVAPPIASPEPEAKPAESVVPARRKRGADASA